MNTFDKEKPERYLIEETGKEDAGFVQEIFTDNTIKNELQSYQAYKWNSFQDIMWVRNQKVVRFFRFQNLTLNISLD